MARTLLVAPAGRRVGLTTVCLGLVRAFDRLGARVALAKPIGSRGADHTVEVARRGAGLDVPEPFSRQQAEELLARGDDQTLMEHVVALCGRAAPGADVVIVEGMIPESGMVYSGRVNALMLKALDAELVLVGTPSGQTAREVAESVAIAARGYGALTEGRTVACVLNRIAPGRRNRAAAALHTGFLCDCDDAVLTAEELAAYQAALVAEKLLPLGLVPCQHDISAPRVKDLALAVGALVLHEGDAARRRVRRVILGAMTVPNAIHFFAPGTFLVTPGDRSDLLLAAAVAVMSGVPLAGVLFTGGLTPDAGVIALCRDALAKGLPLLSVPVDSFTAASRIHDMDLQVPPDDLERIGQAMDTVADHLDTSWLRATAGDAREQRLSPPAFRYRLIEQARAANKRIVLPEGTEPRTIAAAAIAQERGIARCVLLGPPEEIRETARRLGVVLPSSIEIIDPTALSERYVEALVERRRHKGMTAERARGELLEPITVGTLMMAEGHADGLVSGAVHTTAHTIRPALQLIKTVPGVTQVSSVFFMCLPDQVLVFGDCAVVPNPTAEELADIAILSADSAKAFGIAPRVAMLSYSTGVSGGGAEVEKVKKATLLAQQRRPDLLIDGPLQYDAAIMPDVARTKAPGSPVAGKATVFIFPDLNSGNVTYKAVQRSANVVSMGPMLQGLAKPVNDLSRGCLVEDIVFTIALTAIQAKQAATRAG